MKLRLFAALFAASGIALAALQANPVAAAEEYQKGAATGTLEATVAEKVFFEIPASPAGTGTIELDEGQPIFKAEQNFRVMSNRLNPSFQIQIKPNALSTPYGIEEPMKVRSLWDHATFGTQANYTYSGIANQWTEVEGVFRSDPLRYPQADAQHAVEGKYTATVDYTVTFK